MITLTPIHRWLRRIGRSALPFAAAAAASAQTVVPAATTADSADGNANAPAITLSPFEVNSNALNGYTASRSLTGSRVAQDIKQLPFSIDVTTTELWDDFAISPMSGSETLSTVPGMSPLENFAAYAIRGINTSYELLEDGMKHFGRVDAINTDRLEVIKGPAANIYGYTLPGGLVNAVPKVPGREPESKIAIAGGDQGFMREELETTGPLLPGKVYYRIGVSKTHDEGQAQVYRSNRLNALGGQLLWDISQDSSLRVDLSYTDEKRSGRDGVLEAVTESHSASGAASTVKDFGPAWFFPNFDRNINSEPWGYSIFRNKEIDATYVNRLNDAWSLRIVGNVRALNLFTLRGRGNWDPNTNMIWSQEPDAGFEHHHGHQMSGELTGNIDFAGMSHRILVALDYARTVDEVGPTRRLDPAVYSVANGYPNSQRIKEWVATNESQQFFTFPPLGAFVMEYRDQIPANIVMGTLLSDQVKLLHDKLLVTLGGRFDRIHQIIDNLITTNGIPVHQQTWLSAPTVQSGVNYALTHDAMLYGSFSTSFQPQTVLADDGSAFPPIKGKGYDVGIKSDLVKDQLFTTFGYFDLSETNILSQQTINGVTVNLLTGKIASHGLEFSLGGKLWKALTVKLGVGDTLATTASNVTNPTVVGLPVRGISQWNVGGVLKYDFKNGFYAGYNVTYLSNYRYSDSTSPALAHIFLPSWIRHDATVGYSWDTDHGRMKNTVGVVVKNVANKDYMYGTDPSRGLPRGYVVRYALDFR